MRVGVFGGTFDPVHVGHLILAEQCREQARLDRVLFIPAARPPHKLERPLSSFTARVEMLALALSGNPAFVIEELEKDRPGPSFTVDTLRMLQERGSADELHLILGSDAVHDLPGWHEPRRIVEQAGLVVCPRPGWTIPSAEDLRKRLALPVDGPLRMQVVAMPLVEISSSDLRRRVGQGRSIRYQAPRSVEAYIAEKRLYQH